MRIHLLAVVFASVFALGGCAPSAACVVGASQACACVGGGSGAQVCVAGGTFGACDCAGAPDAGRADAGLEEDAPGLDGGGGIDAGGACPSGLSLCGDRCVDTTTDEENCGGCADPTHTCAPGAYCIDASCVPLETCPPPFVLCGADCIDPSSNRAHCGASGDCLGANVGDACGGGCDAGECVFDSCSDALARGETADGLYLVDVDGTGPIPPRDAYCDMTTEGGGWTLVYRIRNDIPDIADPWWPMVGVGSGDAFPTSPTPLPSGTHFEGPVREVRATFGERSIGSRGSEVRVTHLESSGAVRLDAHLIASDVLAYPALGRTGGSLSTSGTCMLTSIPESRFGTVISAASGLSLMTGDAVAACFSSAFGGDAIMLGRTAGTPTYALCGDETAGSTTTTLFWTRPYSPP